MTRAVALIPARGGSVRVPGKNIRSLAGRPLLAYSIGSARESGVFADVIVSTDSAEIASVAAEYGAAVPGLRDAALATATSADVEWVVSVMKGRDEEAFAILRPTSPFRSADTIRRAWRRFLEFGQHIDSMRAVEPVRQHPGKMWILEDDVMRPLLDQGSGTAPYHSSQMAALPQIWVQNSSLEIAWSRVLRGIPSIAGERIAPFFTEGYEGLTIDYPEDFDRAERLVRDGFARLPVV
jgi:N-acylneuraminate cytidylyltransferase